MVDIKIYELKRMDLKDATIIDGFPSVGLISSIVANYLVNALDLEHIGIMDSPYFPTVSLIRDGTPQNPVRIYGGGTGEARGKIVTFISEFQPPPNLVKQIASTMLDWAEEQRCSLIISPEGLVIERAGVKKVVKGERGYGRVRVYGIGTGEKGKKLLLEQKVSPFKEGLITGVAGVLLNEGTRRDFNVVGLLAEAHPTYPDARAAARVIEIIDKMLLHKHIDLQPLYEEAEKIEAQIKTVRKQTEKVAAVKPVKYERPSIYR